MPQADGVPEQGERRERAKTMIETPDRWPCWPVLPMKRYTEEGGFTRVEAGWSITADYPTTLVHGFLNMQGIIRQLADGGGGCGLETQTYDSIDAMLDDGWTVD